MAALCAVCNTAMDPWLIKNGWTTHVNCFEGPKETEVASELRDEGTQLEIEHQPKARVTDPQTSHDAAALIRARSGSARVRLLEAHGRRPEGLTDEEAAVEADISLLSEYATRMSELERAELVTNTNAFREGRSGMSRIVRRISDKGLAVLAARQVKSEPEPDYF